VLKLATSGSTWFASLLDECVGVEARPEVITGKGVGAPESTQVNSLRRALTFKRDANTDVALATQNAKNLPRPDVYRAVVDATDARLVVYQRTNLVKHAIGIWRGRQLEHAPGCATKNVKAARAKQVAACALPEANVTLPLGKFVESLVTASYANGVLAGVASATGLEYYVVTYEGLMVDRRKELTGLFDYLGKPGVVYPRAKTKPDKYLKATGDDLRELLSSESFAAIERWLERAAPCLLPALRDPTPGVMAPCPVGWEYSAAELEAFYAGTLDQKVGVGDGADEAARAKATTAAVVAVRERVLALGLTDDR